MVSGFTPSKEALRLVADGPRLALMGDGRRVANIAVSVEVVGRAESEVRGWSAKDGGWTGAAGRLRGTVVLEPVPDGAIASAALINEGKRAVVLRRFRLNLQLAPEVWGGPQGPLCGLKIGYCGAHSRSPHSRSGVVPLSGSQNERSWWVGALAPRRGGPGIVLGGADFTRYATAVDLGASEIAAVEFLEGSAIAPGERLTLAPVWVGVSPGAPLELLEAYALEVGRRHQVRPREAPCGWGSWGHFFERIDADLMHENLMALDGTRLLRRAVDVVQIDDGWSELLDSHRASASWQPNRRFPSGIAPLAEAVRQHGRTCGLWILPFTVNEGSSLAETHPEYLVQDESARPKRVGGGTSFCLDPSHPGARRWITDTFTRLRDWGVSYVKLDHVRAMLMPDPDAGSDDLDAPRVHRERITRVEAYRRGLTLVREALGPDAFLVGCSAPAGPGAGLVDAHRVGPDIEPVWEGTSSGIRDAARALAANFFWQGRAWVNDPDYLLGGASVEESRFWATAVALSGGSAIISADLGELPAWQEELFAMVTPPTGRSARPLDLFEHGPEPRLWHLRLEGSTTPWDLVGLFNWGTRPTVIPLDLPALGLEGSVHVWDVWRRRHHVAQVRDTLFVEAHSAALLALRPATGEPQLVGTDVHFAPSVWAVADEHWDPTSRTLRVAASPRLPRAGSAFIWTPVGLRGRRGCEPVAVRPDLLRLPLERAQACELLFADSP